MIYNSGNPLLSIQNHQRDTSPSQANFRFSHAVLTDKANSGKVDADIEDRAHDKQQQSIATTNTVF